ERELVLHPHRLYDSAGEPLDPPARHVIRLRARQSGRAEASVRVVASRYERGGLNTAPTRSERLDRTLPLDVGSGWRELLLPLDDLDPDVNRVAVSIQLAPPERGNAQLYVDGLQWLELRPAREMPARWGAYTALYSEVDATVEVRQLAAP